jgi:hypothetical protein
LLPNERALILAMNASALYLGLAAGSLLGSARPAGGGALVVTHSLFTPGNGGGDQAVDVKEPVPESTVPDNVADGISAQIGVQIG